VADDNDTDAQWDEASAQEPFDPNNWQPDEPATPLIARPSRRSPLASALPATQSIS
jgi:hypothetical protein